MKPDNIKDDLLDEDLFELNPAQVPHRTNDPNNNVHAFKLRQMKKFYRGDIVNHKSK
jgi:P pilus assembly chaperone PapD